MEKHCVHCNVLIKKDTRLSHKQWNAQRFCSRRCWHSNRATRRCYPKFSDVDSDLRSVEWYLDSKGYVRSWGHGCAHRCVLERVLGRAIAKGMCCDHIDYVKTNNRRDNLQEVTIEINSSCNRGVRCGLYAGAAITRNGRWKSYIYTRRNGKLVQVSAGTHDTEQDALDAAKRKRASSLAESDHEQ